MFDSFVFYRSFAEAMKELPADEYKEVMVALSEYALDGKDPENLSPVCKAMFILCKPQIDANNARRESGRKGGLKQNEAKPKQMKAKGKQTQAKPKQTQPNVNVNDNDNYIPSKEGIKDPVLEDAIKAYKDYRKKMKAPLTDRALELALSKLEQLAPGDSAKKAAIIDQTIAQGWKGLFPLHEETPVQGISRQQDLDAALLRGVIANHDRVRTL